MCGRYYVDDDTAKEIEKLVRQVDEKLRGTATPCKMEIATKDIHPTDVAPILISSGSELECRWQRWGFPGFQKGQVIFNARCESAMEKPLFKEGIMHRRAVIPASGFYEWDCNKQKHTFYREGQPVIYMAGCYREYEDGNHFVILTTGANASMEVVHDRMPLILDRAEVVNWLLKDEDTRVFLRKLPPMLERRTDYEQLNLFGS